MCRNNFTVAPFYLLPPDSNWIDKEAKKKMFISIFFSSFELWLIFVFILLFSSICTRISNFCFWIQMYMYIYLCFLFIYSLSLENLRKNFFLRKNKETGWLFLFEYVILLCSDLAETFSFFIFIAYNSFCSI